MHLVEIFLPLNDNRGQPFSRERFDEVRRELTDRFGGMTGHTRAPAEGHWQDGDVSAKHDEIVIFEVMADELDREWWRTFRTRLETLFRQDQVLIRASSIEVI